MIMEWIIDFIEFFREIILIAIGYTIYYFYTNRGMRHDGGASTYHYHEPTYYHEPSDDPDFSYMSHDAPEEPDERNYLVEGYNGERLDPSNPDHYPIYDSYND